MADNKNDSALTILKLLVGIVVVISAIVFIGPVLLGVGAVLLVVAIIGGLLAG